MSRPPCGQRPKRKKGPGQHHPRARSRRTAWSRKPALPSRDLSQLTAAIEELARSSVRHSGLPARHGQRCDHHHARVDAPIRVFGKHWAVFARLTTVVAPRNPRRRANVFLLFVHFCSSIRRHFLLPSCLIVINSGTDQIFESTHVNLITLEEIDRSSRVAFEARVEELVRLAP